MVVVLYGVVGDVFVVATRAYFEVAMSMVLFSASGVYGV